MLLLLPMQLVKHAYNYVAIWKNSELDLDTVM